MVRVLWILSLVIPAGLVAQSDGFVSLMPNHDVRELWDVINTPAEVWSVADGVIACKGMPMGFLRSKKKYKNFVFRAEWRFKKEGWTKAPERWPNAGFFIHASEELRERKPRWPASFVEIQGHYGEKGSVFGAGIQGAQRGPLVKDHIPFGEWDRYEVTAKNGTVRAVLNGKFVNEGHDASPAEGYICLQSEGWPVFYRNVEIKVLPD